jgi:alginate O-acetyltransferase complex protein AlgI
MHAYLPASPLIPLAVVAMVAGLLVVGYALQRTQGARGWGSVIAWSLLVAGIGAVDRLASGEPAGVRMLALIGYALVAMKVIVVVAERARGMAPLSLGRWLAFAVLWLGMQPRLFAKPRRGPLPGAGALFRRGAINAIAGEALIVLAWLAWRWWHSHLMVTVLLLPGLSLLLHFGFCNLLAGVWRFAGVPCAALFRAPLQARSLGEFWSRRWNLAFSEMTSIAVYRPLEKRVGRPLAVYPGFAVSGLLHEVAISVPVRAGFGLPLLYFLLHGALVLIEGVLARRGLAPRGWLGRAWTLFWLAAPLPILFHGWFLAGVVWPLVGAGP